MSNDIRLNIHSTRLTPWPQKFSQSKCLLGTEGKKFGQLHRGSPRQVAFLFLFPSCVEPFVRVIFHWEITKRQGSPNRS